MGPTWTMRWNLQGEQRSQRTDGKEEHAHPRRSSRATSGASVRGTNETRVSMSVPARGKYRLFPEGAHLQAPDVTKRSTRRLPTLGARRTGRWRMSKQTGRGDKCEERRERKVCRQREGQRGRKIEIWRFGDLHQPLAKGNFGRHLDWTIVSAPCPAPTGFRLFRGCNGKSRAVNSSSPASKRPGSSTW